MKAMELSPVCVGVSVLVFSVAGYIPAVTQQHIARTRLLFVNEIPSRRCQFIVLRSLCVQSGVFGAACNGNRRDKQIPWDQHSFI